MHILRAIGDDSLEWMEEAPLAEARDYLCDLPGVGRKTAACVLLFSYGRPEVPVDTHVYRVGTARAVAAEDEPRAGARRDAAARPPGRRIRDPRAADPARPPDVHGAQPRCRRCPLLRMCPEGKRRVS